MIKLKRIEIKRFKKKREAGFTLVELIASLGLGILASIIIISVIAPNLKRLAVVQSNESLHADAVFLTDKLTYWVKQGKILNVPSTSTLKILLPGPDSPIKTIEKSGSNVMLDGQPLLSDDIELVNLSFLKMKRSVRVNFELRTKEGQELSITTTIAQRNIF